MIPYTSSVGVLPFGVMRCCRFSLKHVGSQFTRRLAFIPVWLLLPSSTRQQRFGARSPHPEVSGLPILLSKLGWLALRGQWLHQGLRLVPLVPSACAWPPSKSQSMTFTYLVWSGLTRRCPEPTRLINISSFLSSTALPFFYRYW